MAKKLNKGQKLEEHLRMYFLSAGYYVARGVLFKYEGFDVTDIDLWLYSRTSPLARNISIVDIKNKKTPQAIERIFWVKGLAKAVNANAAIVATTDKRQEVKDFGNELDVLVLDGYFMAKLTKSSWDETNRLTNEDFFEIIDGYKLGKLDGDWKGKVEEAKGLLASGLNFNNCNRLLDISKFFAQQILTKPSRVDVALRCFYLCLSFLAIGIDYLLRELSFLDAKERIKKLVEGFTYGSKGKAGLDKMLNTSLNLVEQFAPEESAITSKVRINVQEEFSNLPTQILGEYFSSNEVGKTLFDVAKELEAYAMASNFSNHKSSSIQLKSYIGCLLDYWSINRKELTDAMDEIKA